MDSESTSDGIILAMKYKALFLDLDGTTVHYQQSQVTQKVREAVIKADKVVKVCLATGRILSFVKPIVADLQLSGLCVIANGIQIYDPNKVQIIKQTGIPLRMVKPVFSLLTSYKLEVRQFNGTIDLPYQGEPTDRPILSLYTPVVKNGLADEIIDKLNTLGEKLTAHKMTTEKDGIVGLEVCHPEASKLHAILEVAKLLQINTHEIIGVGDSYNDFPLLMACGFKVAMGNAVPELKAIADFIAPPVDEDGVATVIEKFILT